MYVLGLVSKWLFDLVQEEKLNLYEYKTIQHPISDQLLVPETYIHVYYNQDGTPLMDQRWANTTDYPSEGDFGSTLFCPVEATLVHLEK